MDPAHLEQPFAAGAEVAADSAADAPETEKTGGGS